MDHLRPVKQLQPYPVIGQRVPRTASCAGGEPRDGTHVAMRVFSRNFSFLRRPDRPVLAASDPAPSIALNMPQPGWQVNSEIGPCRDCPTPFSPLRHVNSRRELRFSTAILLPL